MNIPKSEEKLEQKIEELNKYVGGCLSIIFYADWQVISYRADTIFYPPEQSINNASVKEAIDEAYEAMLRDRENKLIDYYL